MLGYGLGPTGAVSMALLTARLCPPAVGHHIDLPPAPPATSKIKSLASHTTGTIESSSFWSTQSGIFGPLDLPRFLTSPQGWRARSNKSFLISRLVQPAALM